ncbi:MAG TPA: TonB-dependent receptor [Gemmatimonadaceae bacterium]|nr:TonB-dependent receptor [Gemmatimonadaceae bacterium]
MTRLVRLASRAGLAAIVGVALAAPKLVAQDRGRITGRVVDATTGKGLPDAGVQIVGTTLGAQSGVDGRYTVVNVPAGTVTIQVRRLGFQPKTITGVLLDAGTAVEQDVAMTPATVQLSEQVVTAAAERGTVNEALDQQRRASGIVSAVTAEQIQKSPDGDAAQAVQRVSGVTVQDGRYVFVRGLGERYTTTSLNGARLPSPEPERKVVPLDLFPSGLLQSVTTSKTFTPDQQGDFSGAQVDIRTREFPAMRQTVYSVSMGYNDRATGKEVLRAPTEGSEWLGFGGSARDLPGLVGATGNFGSSPSQPEYNAMVNAFRNAWSVGRGKGAPNSSFSVSVGGNDPVLGRQIGYLGSLTYSYTQEVRADEVRAFPIVVAGGDGSVTTSEVDRFEGSTGRTSVLWGGLMNLSTMLGTRHRISLNNTYTRSADNDARSEVGIDENSGLEWNIQRLRFVERSVRSTQLAGEHQLAARHHLDWSLTASGVSRVEPDRSEITYARDPMGGSERFLLASNESAVRTFGDLQENGYSASADYSWRFGAGETHTVKVGGLGRYTNRGARNRVYGIDAQLPIEDRRRAPEAIFGGDFAGADDAVFRVIPLFQAGSYKAEEALGAGYAMVEYQLRDRVRIIGGARVEHTALAVVSEPFFGSALSVEKMYTDVLPSAAVNVQLTEGQNLRFSVSQTLARPEYRELVPINQRDVISGEESRGNPALERTLIQNADVRWEWYPNPGEVLSLAVFAKHFQDPIERLYRGTSGTRITTFENAESAVNYGVELEVRKGLGFIAEPLAPFTAFSNVTVMDSEIDIGNTGAAESEPQRAMVGQAPYVVNAGLTFGTERGVSATALYNVVGRRIFAAALLPLPSVYEEERHVVDLSLRVPLWGGVAARFDARNLLDEPYEVTQGTVTREYYRPGRTFAAGLSWRP